MENNRNRHVRPSELFMINGRLQLASHANIKSSTNVSAPVCDDDVILIEREIPFIDLCTPDVPKQPRKPLFVVNDNRKHTGHSISKSSGSCRRLNSYRIMHEEGITKAPAAATQSISDSSGSRRLNSIRNNSLDEFFDRITQERGITKAPAAATQSIVENASQKPPVMCIICSRSAIGRKPHATRCGHVFCENCIKRSLVKKNECPTCKKFIYSVSPLHI